MTGTNFTLRDEIKAYWSARAATFDEQPGHEIFGDAERAAWHALILRHLGPGSGRPALDLGCGTGVVSQLMDELGYDVTGMDWAEPMLERARSKAEQRKRPIRFLTGDAERTMEPSGTYDAIIARHLVWTLVDPAAAFAEWHRVLKPGGHLLLIDGDFVTPTWVTRLRNLIRYLGLHSAHAGGTNETVRTHRNILARVHFAQGARAPVVAEMLEQGGFGVESIDTNLRAIRRAQGRRMTLDRRLDRAAQHRYAIRARRRG